MIKKRSTKKGKHLVKVHVKVREGEKPIPKFEQKIGESNNAFLYRVNQICESVQREAAFEKKYGVDVKRDSVTGKVQGIMKRQKDPLELIVQSVKKEKKKKKLQKKKKKDSNTEEMIKLSKSQKRQMKLKEKKKRKETNNEKEFDSFSDTIKFGEITHAPPNLVTPRMIAKNNEKPRPGQKQLLLKSIINKTGSETNVEKPVGKSDIFRKGVNHKVIDKKGKRKDLPNALRRQLDKQQKEIIDVYKSIKAQKRIKS
ncbi:hypothetical protein WA026_001778 [Henosepilachna vigintioctopunctata]|uniref:Coiled-coil domain-containing protein n=1 Tax=Henosepilachna vigintioctopunctata TaxID=420089 RepID=A0AAW1UQX5_9CUCU